MAESVIGGSLTIKCHLLHWPGRRECTNSKIYIDEKNSGLFFITRG